MPPRISSSVLIAALLLCSSGIARSASAGTEGSAAASGATSAASEPPGMALAVLPSSVPAPVANPGTAAKAELGRLLFFDPILSARGDVSCATCHDPRWGWTDGRALPIGTGGTGSGPARVPTGTSVAARLTRNTPSLLNVAFNGLVSGRRYLPESAPMFWDARVSGLEAQVTVPIGTPGEMCGEGCRSSEAIAAAVDRVAAIPAYRERFRAVFGGTDAPAVTATQLGRAIAAFERMLVTPPSAFDRFLAGDAGALSAEQRHGLEVLRTAGCTQCHGGPMFSDFQLHVVGSPGAPAGERREFRTPTLRNLRHTAPFMHDGRLRRVRDVLVFYEDLAEAVSETLDGGAPADGPPLDPLLRRLNLSADDFPALEAFLDALSVDDFDRTAPKSVPSGLPVAAAQ